jgi:hypothetical protein
MGAYGVKIAEVTFESTALTYVGENAFARAEVIDGAKVTIPEIDFWYGIEFANMQSNPLGIGADLYVGDAIVDTLVIDKDSVSAYLFAGCKSLKNVTVNAAIIGEYAFYGCENLEALVFGENLSVIETYAFVGCNALASVQFATGSGWKLYNSYDKAVSDVNVSAATISEELSNSKSGYTWKRTV